MKCPNKSDKRYKELVERLGSDYDAYMVWNENGEDFPDNINDAVTKYQIAQSKSLGLTPKEKVIEHLEKSKAIAGRFEQPDGTTKFTVLGETVTDSFSSNIESLENEIGDKPFEFTGTSNPKHLTAGNTAHSMFEFVGNGLTLSEAKVEFEKKHGIITEFFKDEKIFEKTYNEFEKYIKKNTVQGKVMLHELPIILGNEDGSIFGGFSDLMMVGNDGLIDIVDLKVSSESIHNEAYHETTNNGKESKKAKHGTQLNTYTRVVERGDSLTGRPSGLKVRTNSILPALAEYDDNGVITSFELEEPVYFGTNDYSNYVDGIIPPTDDEELLAAKQEVDELKDNAKQKLEDARSGKLVKGGFWAAMGLNLRKTLKRQKELEAELNNDFEEIVAKKIKIKFKKGSKGLYKEIQNEYTTNADGKKVSIYDKDELALINKYNRALVNLNNTIQLIQNTNNKFNKYIETFEEVNKVLNTDLSKMTLQQLLDVYSASMQYDEIQKMQVFNSLKNAIAHKFWEDGKQYLRSMGYTDDEIKATSLNKRKDMSKFDVLFKSLAHVTESHPDLQELAREVFHREAKMNNELAEEMAKWETVNKKLAKIIDKDKSWLERIYDFIFPFFIDKSQYYDNIIDRNKGVLINKNSKEYAELSKKATAGDQRAKAEIDVLNAARMIQGKYKNTLLDKEKVKEFNYIPTQKAKFAETFKKYRDSGETKYSSWFLTFTNQLWQNYDLKDVKVEFDLPGLNNSVQKNYKEYSQAVKQIISSVESGLMTKVESTKLLMQIRNQANKAVNEGATVRGETVYQRISNARLRLSNGRLVGRYGMKERAASDKSYDVFEAYKSFLNEMTFIKHYENLIPVMDSLENIFKNNKNPNSAKYLEIFKTKFIFKEEIAIFGAKNIAGVHINFDKAINQLIGYTHWVVMAVNMSAAALNVIVGKTNVYRDMGIKNTVKGEVRYAKLIKSSSGRKKLDTILRRYGATSVSLDTKLKYDISDVFKLATMDVHKMAEHYIQSAHFLAQMDEKEFEEELKNIDDDGEIIDPNIGLKNDIAQKYKKKVSDAHGAYGAVVKRNYAAFSLGRAVGQFKTWLPDFLKERFGGQYIDLWGVKHEGTGTGMLRIITTNGLKDIKEMMKNPSLWNSDQLNYRILRKNLQGVLGFVSIWMIYLLASDDENENVAGNMLSKALGDMAYAYRLDSYKSMVSNPVISLSVMNNLIKAVETSFDVAEYHIAGGDPNKNPDYHLYKALKNVAPAKSAFNYAENLLDEE